MSNITVFGSQAQWEHSGSFYIRGASTTYRPGALYHDPLVAYCMGPPSLASGAADTSAFVTGSLQYVWRARYTASYGGSQSICLERQDISNTTWLPPTASFAVPVSILFTDTGVTSIESVDMAISNRGLYYVLIEIPSSGSIGNKDVYLYTPDTTNTSATGMSVTGSLSGTNITPTQNIFIQICTGASGRIVYGGGS